MPHTRLDADRFFDNLDGIAAFAFAGTAISTAAIGGLVWASGAAGLCLPLSPLHALLFGSIVSATDPVSWHASRFLISCSQTTLCLYLVPVPCMLWAPSAAVPAQTLRMLLSLQVTVLAVFQRLGANADLYALVFGESVLNDAVAVVLFRSLSGFQHTTVTPAAIALAVASFVGIFAGSVVVSCASVPAMLVGTPMLHTL